MINPICCECASNKIVAWKSKFFHFISIFFLRARRSLRNIYSTQNRVRWIFVKHLCLQYASMWLTARSRLSLICYIGNTYTHTLCITRRHSFYGADQLYMNFIRCDFEIIVLLCAGDNIRFEHIRLCAVAGTAAASSFCHILDAQIHRMSVRVCKLWKALKTYHLNCTAA